MHHNVTLVKGVLLFSTTLTRPMSLASHVCMNTSSNKVRTNGVHNEIHTRVPSNTEHNVLHTELIKM